MLVYMRGDQTRQVRIPRSGKRRMFIANRLIIWGLTLSWNGEFNRPDLGNHELGTPLASLATLAQLVVGSDARSSLANSETERVTSALEHEDWR
jgi:hypothetical protein